MTTKLKAFNCPFSQLCAEAVTKLMRFIESTIIASYYLQIISNFNSEVLLSLLIILLHLICFVCSIFSTCSVYMHIVKMTLSSERVSVYKLWGMTDCSSISAPLRMPHWMEEMFHIVIIFLFQCWTLVFFNLWLQWS